MLVTAAWVNHFPTKYLTFPATKISSEFVHAMFFLARRLSDTPTDTVKTVGKSGGSTEATVYIA
jgi:hypothetical protein